MLNGKQHGYGVQEWNDGAKYEGEWKNGKTNGYGTFYHPGGDIYKGYWKDDKANGRGKYTSSGGIEYDGEWSNDCQDGYGTETWNDGSLFKENIDIRNVVINQVLMCENPDKCKMCRSRTKMQKKYLEKIEEMFEDFHIIKIPLQKSEIRGTKMIEDFSRFLIEKKK